MRPHSAPVHVQRVAPATCGALAAVVLLLAAVSLFLQGCLAKPDPPGAKHPNYYACECTCTTGSSDPLAFAVDQRVRVIIPIANIRLSAAGTLIGQQAAGAEGMITEDGGELDFEGVLEHWWRVTFSTGASGFVIQRALEVRQVLMGKAHPSDICLPTDLNANRGGHEPTHPEIVDDCKNRVAADFGQIAGQDLPPNAECTCEARADLATMYDASCDNDCPGGAPVCTVMGTDPEQPTPDPLSITVFRTTSVCDVTGTLTLTVSGHQPKKQPDVRGVLQIHGRPCPGGTCPVGLAYRLSGDDIEFDSGTIFASDPKFVDLSLSGATQANVIALGPLLPGAAGVFGELPAGAALSTVQGRRAGSSTLGAVVVRNTVGLGLIVNWVDKTCRLAGDLVGAVDGDGTEGTLDVQAAVELDGVIVNQPPLANAGPDQTLECTSPSGADISLSAAGSADRDSNIAFYVWRRGSETGPQVADPSSNPVVHTHQAIGETTYHLRVVDGNAAADSASVKVNVVDTTAPVISCNAPATIPKPERPIAFRATATDSCGPAPAVVIENFECFKVKKHGPVKVASCKVAIQGDTLRINKTGGADLIRWRTRAADAASNVGGKTCEVSIAKEEDDD